MRNYVHKLSFYQCNVATVAAKNFCGHHVARGPHFDHVFYYLKISEFQKELEIPGTNQRMRRG